MFKRFSKLFYPVRKLPRNSFLLQWLNGISGLLPISEELDHILASRSLQKVMIIPANKRQISNLLTSVVLQTNEIEVIRFSSPFFTFSSSFIFNCKTIAKKTEILPKTVFGGLL